jgi:hypothetical protein
MPNGILLTKQFNFAIRSHNKDLITPKYQFLLLKIGATVTAADKR